MSMLRQIRVLDDMSECRSMVSVARRRRQREVPRAVAWAEQDFSAGSGTTFFFILAPDHTLHPIQEVRSWNLQMPRGSMLGNCKARTWGFTYRALASRVSPQPRHIALRLACCGPTLQPYSLSPCGKAKVQR
jgi:hypothetical protein